MGNVLKKVGRYVCLLIVLLCLIACSPEVIVQGDTNTTPTNHTNGSSQSNDNNGSSSNNTHSNNNDPTTSSPTTPTNPITPNPVSPEDVNPIIDIRSREIIELKEETEEIEGVVYTTKHCVDVHTSTPYFFTYYVFYYSGETLTRCKYWNREPSNVVSLITYSDFYDVVKDNPLNTSSGWGTYFDCYYYDSGSMRDYYAHTYYEVASSSLTHYNYTQHSHYLEDGKIDVDETILIADQLSSISKNVRTYYDSNALKTLSSYSADRITSFVVYNENGTQLITINYSSDSVSNLTSYYDSRKREYYYNNGVLTHYSDDETPTTTKTNMSDSEIKEWIETYISDHCGSLE